MTAIRKGEDPGPGNLGMNPTVATVSDSFMRLLSLLFLGLLLVSTASAGEPVLHRGALPNPPSGDCLTPKQRFLIEREIDEHQARYVASKTALDDAPQSYRFFPQAGTLGQDLFLLNTVDLDPSQGFRDF